MWKNFFDLITFWDVIEHTYSPKENLKKAYSILKPKGHLVVTTDNFESLISYSAALFEKITFGKFAYPIERFFIPHNTCYFKPGNFKTLITDCGFLIKHFEKIDYPIEKINLNGLEKVCVRALYKIGDILNLNSQFVLICEKNNPDIE